MTMHYIRKQMGLVLVVLLVAFLGLAACGDPNREDCKEACTKLRTCDKAENGGSDALDNQWLSSCHASCDEADEIDETTAKCIVKATCDTISACGAGGSAK